MLKNERGFTLIEMLVVMLIISVLLILIIPNLTTQTDSMNEKGCDALVSVVQAQADAYYLDIGEIATIEQLVGQKYIEIDQKECKNNQSLKIDDYGKVALSDNNDD